MADAAKRTQIAKFICREIMDDDWRLGKKLCLGYADEILAIVAAPPVSPETCEQCHGSGQTAGRRTCSLCGGSGRVPKAALSESH